MSLLKSAHKCGTDVKRVVIFSSFAGENSIECRAALTDAKLAAVVNPAKYPHRYYESEWNETSPKILKEKGLQTPGGDCCEPRHRLSARLS